MTTPLKPDYLIRLGGNEVSPRAFKPLIGVRVRAGKNDGAAAATLDFGDKLAFDVAAGDRITIELGWTGDRRLVFTGAVYGFQPSAAGRGTTVRGFGEEMKLTRGRIVRTFENQSHGDIVKAHAKDTGVATGSIEDGSRLSHDYAHHESRYEHCRRLAADVGFDLYTTEEGKLTFARFARRAADHVLHFDRDIRRASFRFTPVLRGVTVVPESPASSSGDETASWLVKDPSPHSATEGEAGVRVLSNSLLRTRDAAKAAARAFLESARRVATSGEVVLGGNVAIRLGQAVELKDSKEPKVNGLYEVRAVEHAVGGQTGFSTTLGVARIDP